MSGETEAEPSGWTIDTLAYHLARVRADDMRFAEERDRRYTEVALEREKALKIKETADETARILVAENQAYRDEKGNELRSQIERERGSYATQTDLRAAVEKIEAQLAPLIAYIQTQQGSTTSSQRTFAGAIAVAGLAIAVALGIR